MFSDIGNMVLGVLIGSFLKVPNATSILPGCYAAVVSAQQPVELI